MALPLVGGAFSFHRKMRPMKMCLGTFFFISCRGRNGGASPAVAQRRHCKICFLLRSPQRYPQNQTLLSKLL